jgi:hypothetical protein
MAAVTPTDIRHHMPVLGSNGQQIGVVDHIDEGETIKLTKDQSGQHHWVPFSWVSSVNNNEVRLDQPANQVMQNWTGSQPGVFMPGSQSGAQQGSKTAGQSAGAMSSQQTGSQPGGSQMSGQSSAKQGKASTAKPTSSKQGGSSSSSRTS